MRHELAINHYLCGDAISFPDFAAQVADAGIRSVGVTRAAIAEMGLDGLKACLADHGLSVSSLNSAGYFTRGGPNPIQYANEALVDAAAFLEADVLCVITGGLGVPPMPVAEAREHVKDGFADLAGRASAAGVVLGLEPIYPADILTKGCINSCSDGLEFVAPHPNAKLIVDLYHSWWDPDLPTVFRDRPTDVALIQLCNLRMDHGLVVGRTTLASGGLRLDEILRALASSEYGGKLELELFDRDLKGMDPRQIIRQFPSELDRLLRA